MEQNKAKIGIDDIPTPTLIFRQNGENGGILLQSRNSAADDITGATILNANPDTLFRLADGGGFTPFLQKMATERPGSSATANLIVAATGASQTVEARIRHQQDNGDFIVQLLRVEPAPSAHPQFSSEHPVISDVLAALPEFLVFVDTELTIRLVNDTAVHWLAAPRVNIIGTAVGNWAKLVRNPEITEWAELALQSGKLTKTESVWQFDDGQIRHVELIIVPAEDSTGAVVGTYIMARDQTEKVVANQRSRAAEQRFRSILRLSPEAVITTGPQGTIRLFSKGAEDIFGYKAHEVIGRSLDVLIPERFRDIHKKHMRNFKTQDLDHIVMTQRSEIIGLTREGREFPASASVSKLEVDNTTLFTVLLHDVTDQRLFEDQLSKAKEDAERANVAKSDFLAGMSHELRTPLNAIIGFSEMITGEVIGPVNNRKYLDYATNIHTAGRHLLSLINDLLDISRLEMGEIEPQNDEVDLVDVIHEVNTMIKGAVDKAELTYNCRIQPNLPNLHGDRRRISQILINILSNAIKFTPRGKSVTTTAFARMGRITITVADTGIGIREEDLDRITDPFVQTHEFDVNKAIESNGVGLGLVRPGRAARAARALEPVVRARVRAAPLPSRGLPRWRRRGSGRSGPRRPEARGARPARAAPGCRA